MNPRKMRIGMSIRGHGYHPAAWRHPDVPAEGTLQVEHYVRSAQTAERGKLDMIFFADGAGIRQGDNPPGSLARTGRDMVELEPTMLLPALAMVTSHIGLVTTASTTYNEPYNLARRFATLDLISKGRAGWNVVASWSEHEAQNFGLETTLDYETRYARSAEFVDVVKGLWDSWDDGALLLDKAGGRYFNEAKMHVLNHHGRFFKVRGPLSVACMPQGHPVIVQAGASEQGRELGAATADVIYAINGSLDVARAYYTDVKGRMPKYGREPDELKIMPAFCPVVAKTRAQAQAKFDQLQALVDPLAGLGSLYSTFGDLSGYPLDGPVPDEAIGKSEIRSLSAQFRERVRQEKPTIRELYLRSGITGSARIGTPSDIADAMQEWFETGACDGFNITPTHLPGGCEDFVALVVPELQRRGLFRSDYEGNTLRENLGLHRPVSRYAAGASTQPSTAAD
ncbi:MAG: LLM class flavin-dependent oxidoreductase [Alphaproteobacteria bacterium]|nr:LLM class flavin-dependent oxidoreductase [Alphaproteobacteria bacterium]